MSHKEIQKKLLLYIDNELSKTETAGIKAHIDSCSDCRKCVDILSGVWKSEETESQEAPPYVWARLEAQIKEYEQNPVFFDFGYIGKELAFMLKPAALAVLIFISVITGYFGGNILSKDMDVNPDISTGEQAAKVFYLDKLEPAIIAYNVNEEVVLQ